MFPVQVDHNSVIDAKNKTDFSAYIHTQLCAFLTSHRIKCFVEPLLVNDCNSLVSFVSPGAWDGHNITQQGIPLEMFSSNNFFLRLKMILFPFLWIICLWSTESLQTGMRQQVRLKKGGANKNQSFLGLSG